jgi:hypothetical protein
LFNSLLQAVVLPLAFFVGARGWGLSGVAIAWLVAWPILYVIVTGQTLRVLGLPVGSYLDALRHPAAGVVTMAAVVIGVRYAIPGGDSSLAGLTLVSAAGAAGYVTYHVAFDRGTLRDVVGTVKIGRARQAAAAAATASVTPLRGSEPGGAAAHETV